MTLYALLAQSGGFNIPDIWLGALLSLAVAGITIVVGLQFSQRTTVTRVDEWVWGDGRNQKGVAAELKEIIPKMWVALDRVDDICDRQEGLEKRVEKREKQWEDFLERERRSGGGRIR